MLAHGALAVGGLLLGVLLARQQRSSRIVRFGASGPLPFAHAVVHGDTVYLAGVTAQADGQPLSESDAVEAQTARVLRVIDERLAKAGTDKSRLLHAQVWLRDIGRDFQKMNGGESESQPLFFVLRRKCVSPRRARASRRCAGAAWNEWVAPGAKPVRATVEARLATPAMLVEIQVTAAL